MDGGPPGSDENRLQEKGATDIFVMRQDGTDVRRLTDDATEEGTTAAVSAVRTLRRDCRRTALVNASTITILIALLHDNFYGIADTPRYEAEGTRRWRCHREKHRTRSGRGW